MSWIAFTRRRYSLPRRWTPLAGDDINAVCASDFVA
jgi:hypothetical protein